MSLFVALGKMLALSVGCAGKGGSLPFLSLGSIRFGGTNEMGNPVRDTVFRING
jgi:hypothetical protein